MHTRFFISSCLMLANIGGGLASTWAIFSDADCTVSVDTVDGQNGYPDGEAPHTTLDAQEPLACAHFAEH